MRVAHALCLAAIGLAAASCSREESSRSVEVTLPRTLALAPGMPVLYAGQIVGRVQRTQPHPRGVAVTLLIRRAAVIELRRGDVARRTLLGVEHAPALDIVPARDRAALQLAPGGWLPLAPEPPRLRAPLTPALPERRSPYRLLPPAPVFQRPPQRV